MKLKLDEAGHVVVQDGKPVYVADDGKEVAFDAAATVATIARINGEAKSNRIEKEAALTALKAFEGLDAQAARRAVDLTKNLDDKRLIDAGEAERVKSETIAAIEGKYAPVVAERDGLLNDLVTEKIGGAFARSKFIADKIAVPYDLVESRFGRNFSLDGRKVVAKDNAGNPIYSRANPGELADFEEALSMLVDSYPHKEHILKGSNNGGAGTRTSQGGAGGAKTITRSSFEQMSPMQQAAAVSKDGFTVVDN